MNKYLIISLFLVACGKGSSGGQGLAGLNGSNCIVVQNVDSATITCPDGSTATLMNSDGCTVEQVDLGVEITCGDTTTLISKTIHDYGKHKGDKGED